MNSLFIFIHTVTCILLTTVILMQSGRGGGLTESFASAESMFGAKTNEFMVRSTTILASVFLVTSLVLAYISSKKEQSLMPETTVVEELTFPEMPSEESAPAAEMPASEEAQ